MSKTVLCVVILALSAWGDRILLTNGQELVGRICSYAAVEGLVVAMEFGRITIKTANLASFVISDDSTGGVVAPTRLPQSTLYQLGLTLDTALLGRFELSFDEEEGEGGGVLVEGDDDSRGLFFIIGAEHFALSNEEYASLTLSQHKRSMQFSRDGERCRRQINGLHYIIKELPGRFQGIDFTYVLGFFTVEEINFRVVLWTFSSVYARRKDELWAVFEAIRPR